VGVCWRACSSASSCSSGWICTLRPRGPARCPGRTARGACSRRSARAWSCGRGASGRPRSRSAGPGPPPGEAAPPRPGLPRCPGLGPDGPPPSPGPRPGRSHRQARRPTPPPDRSAAHPRSPCAPPAADPAGGRSSARTPVVRLSCSSPSDTDASHPFMRPWRCVRLHPDSKRLARGFTRARVGTTRQVRSSRFIGAETPPAIRDRGRILASGLWRVPRRPHCPDEGGDLR